MLLAQQKTNAQHPWSEFGERILQLAYIGFLSAQQRICVFAADLMRELGIKRVAEEGRYLSVTGLDARIQFLQARLF